MEKFFINMIHSFIFLKSGNIIAIESRKFETVIIIIIMSEYDCVATSIELSSRNEIVIQNRRRSRNHGRS
jgi:hypothetical protein